MEINKFEKFTESVSNLSKVRRWNSNVDRNNNKYRDLYFTYDLKKQDLGKYLNTWFIGDLAESKDRSKIFTDEMITLKKVDKETAENLYGREYNPLTIRIMCPTGARFKQDADGNNLYEMKAQIHSIDDSSYGVWWSYYYGSELPFENMLKIRAKIMKWVNSKKVINGEQFLDYCVSLGASEESKDYN